jgi:hypothetical protein
VDDLKSEREARERLATNLDGAGREHANKLRSLRRSLDAKQSALQITLVVARCISYALIQMDVIETERL